MVSSTRLKRGILMNVDGKNWFVIVTERNEHSEFVKNHYQCSPMVSIQLNRQKTKFKSGDDVTCKMEDIVMYPYEYITPVVKN